MGREIAYDQVFHAQRHFRALLESMSRPGTINVLNTVDCAPPSGLSRGSAYIAFALINADVSFHLVGMGDHEAAYLTANTSARPVPIEQAAFIFAKGDAAPDVLEGAHCGTLAYPDTSATLVLQVGSLSSTPTAPTDIRLCLRGPGIDGQTVVYVGGLSADLLLALQARNTEFPLGIDTFLTTDAAGIDAFLTTDGGDQPCVMGLPRTTQVFWEAC